MTEENIGKNMWINNMEDNRLVKGAKEEEDRLLHGKKEENEDLPWDR